LQAEQLVEEQVGLVVTLTVTDAVFPFTVLAVKVAVPALTAEIMPVFETVAIEPDPDQVTVLSEAFAGSTTAFTCCLSPTYKLTLVVLKVIPEGLTVAAVPETHPVSSLQEYPVGHFSEITSLPLAS